MTTYDADDLVEVYAASHQLEADRLVLLLQDDGIDALARATTMSSFPTTGAWLVQVRFGDLDAAKKVIAAARAEGAVSDRGEFTALATAHHGSSSR
jgi:hypothetical protein